MSIRRKLSLLFAAALCAGAAQLWAGSPAWVGSLYPVSMGVVARVVSAEQGDIVIVAGGADQGFRPGMQCQIRRDDKLVANLVIASVREERCAALILSNEGAPQAGDIVKIKTL